jgi:hypothetical protein
MFLTNFFLELVQQGLRKRPILPAKKKKKKEEADPRDCLELSGQ